MLEEKLEYRPVGGGLYAVAMMIERMYVTMEEIRAGRCPVQLLKQNIYEILFLEQFYCRTNIRHTKTLPLPLRSRIAR